MIVGSACPTTDKSVSLVDSRELGTDFFLERREMGILNLGSQGKVNADGIEYNLRERDVLYLGMGTKGVSFEGDGARFYILSCPAHAHYEAKLITPDMAIKSHIGERASANERTIAKYIDPAIHNTCQLAMGITALDGGSVWNTMPPHTHERRMEVYLYVGLAEDDFVVHLMGQEDETRHIIVRNGQAVISPGWSIHSGVGTRAYSFVWGMCGENQTFSDMDAIAMKNLR